MGSLLTLLHSEMTAVLLVPIVESETVILPEEVPAVLLRCLDLLHLIVVRGLLIVVVQDLLVIIVQDNSKTAGPLVT